MTLYITILPHDQDKDMCYYHDDEMIRLVKERCDMFQEIRVIFLTSFKQGHQSNKLNSV